MQPDVNPSMLQPKRHGATASCEMFVTSGQWHQAQMQSNADSSFGDKLQPSYDMQGVSSGQKVSKSAADLQSRIDNTSVPPAVQLPHDYVSGLQQRILLGLALFLVQVPVLSFVFSSALYHLGYVHCFSVSIVLGLAFSSIQLPVLSSVFICALYYLSHV